MNDTDGDSNGFRIPLLILYIGKEAADPASQSLSHTDTSLDQITMSSSPTVILITGTYPPNPILLPFY